MTSGLSGSPAETVCRTPREVERAEVELHERAEERRRRAERGHARALEHAQAVLGIELAALIPEEDRRAHAPLAEELAPGRLGPAGVRERPVQVGGRQVLPEARRDLVPGAHRGVRVQHHLRRRDRARREVEEQRVVGARDARRRLGVARARDQLVVALAAGLGGLADDDHVPQRWALVAHLGELDRGLVVDDGDRRPARSIRWAMSRRVQSVVAGIGTTPKRNIPSSSSYHSGMRGSITNARSPAVTPSPSSALATRREARRELAEGDLAATVAARVERDQRELARVLRGPVLDDVARELVVLRDLQPERPPRVS